MVCRNGLCRFRGFCRYAVFSFEDAGEALVLAGGGLFQRNPHLAEQLGQLLHTH